MKYSYKLTATAVLASLSVIAFVIENLFPPLFIAGAKMGVSNIFILLTMLLIGKKHAFAVLIVKVVLGSLFAGNPSAILYSLPSGLIALTVETLLFFGVKRVSIVACSVAGAVINVTLQNVTFCIITDSTGYLIYLPYLALIGILSGLIVGFAVYLIIKILPNNLLEKIC